MIVGEIRRYLRDNSAIRVSRSMRDTAYRVLQAREKLMAENQREPTVEQIAKVLDIPREEVVFAMDAIVDPVSLYEPIYSTAAVTPSASWTRCSDRQEHRREVDRAHRPEGGPGPAGPSGSSGSWPCASARARPRWRSPPRWASPRPRSPGWRRTPSTPCAGAFRTKQREGKPPSGRKGAFPYPFPCSCPRRARPAWRRRERTVPSTKKRIRAPVARDTAATGKSTASGCSAARPCSVRAARSMP